MLSWINLSLYINLFYNWQSSEIFPYKKIEYFQLWALFHWFLFFFCNPKSVSLKILKICFKNKTHFFYFSFFQKFCKLKKISLISWSKIIDPMIQWVWSEKKNQTPTLKFFGSFPVPPLSKYRVLCLFYVLLRLNAWCYAVKYEEQICSELSICALRQTSLHYDSVK